MIPKGFKLLDHLSLEEKEKYLAERNAKKTEQANTQKVLRRLNKLTKELGFLRKGNWYSKESGYFAHVIHLHKYTFGPCFRMHVLLRVLNDPSEHIALNGLESKELHSWQKKFKFQNSEESILKCAESMFQAIIEVAIPWFDSANLKELMAEIPPLTESGREALVKAVAGEQDNSNIVRSKKLLGLNE